LKQLRLSEVEQLQELQSEDSSLQMNQIVDKWIYLSPISPHIVKAVEVLEDHCDKTYVISEYWHGSPNMF
jgi:hypothetical protein